MYDFWGEIWSWNDLECSDIHSHMTQYYIRYVYGMWFYKTISGIRLGVSCSRFPTILFSQLSKWSYWPIKLAHKLFLIDELSTGAEDSSGTKKDCSIVISHYSAHSPTRLVWTLRHWVWQCDSSIHTLNCSFVNLIIHFFFFIKNENCMYCHCQLNMIIG